MGEDQDWRRRRRRARRRHGLQHPLHPQQVLAWVVMISFIALTFGAIVPALHSALVIPVAVVSGLLFLSHIVAHVVALFLDPADPQLRAQKQKVQMPEFNRNLHSHVIENGRCHLCNITTSSPRTKHCSACNKCVDVFDHHCKWLNHCIGKRNYRVFLVCVVTAILACMFIMGTCIAEIVLYYFDREYLSPWENGRQETAPTGDKESEKDYADEDSPVITCDAGSPYCHFSVFGARVYDGAFIGIISGLFSLTLIVEVLLIHLAAFHAYINYLGLTTYEYIRGNNLRDSTSARSFNTFVKEQNSDPEGAVCGWKVIKRSSNNQITPSSTTDTSLLQTPSNDSSIGSRSPRSASATASPSTQHDSPFNFNFRNAGQRDQSPSLRCHKEAGSSTEAPSKVSSPQHTPRTPPSSSVPVLPQIPKPVRSRIGLRSTTKNILSSSANVSPTEKEVEVRIVSIPRPRPSRRRLRSTSVAPHLSPIKECDMATASPPSVRGEVDALICNPPSKAGQPRKLGDTDGASPSGKSYQGGSTWQTYQAPSFDESPMKSKGQSPSKICQQSSRQSPSRDQSHARNDCLSPSKLSSMPNCLSPSKSSYPSPSKSNGQSPSKHSHVSPSKANTPFSRSHHLNSPSHSQIYPQLSASLSSTRELYCNSPTKIFVVAEQKHSSPGYLKGTTANGKLSSSSPNKSRQAGPQKSPMRAASPSLNSPQLMAHINGKNVAITILNGHLENGGVSPLHQNGRIISRILNNNVDAGESEYRVGICKASDLRIVDNEVFNKSGNFEKSSGDKSGRTPNQNGTTHMELHM